jgi:hypothetical protein
MFLMEELAVEQRMQTWKSRQGVAVLLRVS